MARRRCLAVLWFAATLLVSAPALAAWALPYADGTKIERLVKPAAPLPGGFELASARVQRALLVVDYRSATGQELTVVLRHPSLVEGAAAVTERFSLHLEGAEPARHRDLVNELVAHLKRHEGEWRWVLVDLDGAPSPGEAVRPPPDPFGVDVLLWSLVVLLGSVALIRLLRPRRGRVP